MINPEDFIPEGLYCYTVVDGETHVCPHWELIEDKPAQCNGYCHYLGEGDWDVDGLSLLWDQCKECGIHMSDGLFHTDLS